MISQEVDRFGLWIKASREL